MGDNAGNRSSGDVAGNRPAGDVAENKFCASTEWLQEYENVDACEKFIAVARGQTEIEMNKELSMPIAFTDVQKVYTAMFKNAEFLEMEVSVAVSACILYERLYRRIQIKDGRLNQPNFELAVLTFNFVDIFICLFLSAKYIQDYPPVKFTALSAVMEMHHKAHYNIDYLRKREAKVLKILSYQVHFQHPLEISISLYMKLKKKYPELSFNLNEEYINQLHIAIDLFYNYSNGVQFIMKSKYQIDHKSLWLRYLMFDPLHVGMTLTLFIMEKNTVGRNIDSTEALYEDLESWSNVARYYCLCLVAYMSLLLDKKDSAETVNFILQNYTSPGPSSNKNCTLISD